MDRIAPPRMKGFETIGIEDLYLELYRLILQRVELMHEMHSIRTDNHA